MHIIAHTRFDGDFQDYPALLLDWDRCGPVATTTGPVTAIISLPGGLGPVLRVVSLEHVTRRTSTHYWRRPIERGV